jgi:tripartite-type tricarboxylate transporter receptor subunit TctC
MDRRHCLLALATVAATPLPAWAQGAYPARSVRVVIGFPPGSATDVATRVVAESLARRTGQAFVVENRPGAASNIAARSVSSAAADGYTLFIGTVANTINAGFPNSTAADLSRDFVPVAMIGSVPNMLVVHPSLNVSSVDELVRLARSRPGDISYASSGNGTSPHLSAELFSSMAGIRMTHVPYKGSSQAVTDLLGGQVQLMFSPASTVLPHVRTGKLKGLATTGATRAAVAPDLATIAELGMKGFETSVWFGVVAPPGTPAEVVTRLNAAVNAALDAPDVQEQLRANGIDAVKSSPEDFARYIRSESAKWAKVIQAAGLKPE